MNNTLHIFRTPSSVWRGPLFCRFDYYSVLIRIIYRGGEGGCSLHLQRSALEGLFAAISESKRVRQQQKASNKLISCVLTMNVNHNPLTDWRRNAVWCYAQICSHLRSRYFWKFQHFSLVSRYWKIQENFPSVFRERFIILVLVLARGRRKLLFSFFFPLSLPPSPLFFSMAATAREDLRLLRRDIRR